MTHKKIINLFTPEADRQPIDLLTPEANSSALPSHVAMGTLSFDLTTDTPLLVSARGIADNDNDHCCRNAHHDSDRPSDLPLLREMVTSSPLSLFSLDAVITEAKREAGSATHCHAGIVASDVPAANLFSSSVAKTINDKNAPLNEKRAINDLCDGFLPLGQCRATMKITTNNDAAAAELLPLDEDTAMPSYLRWRLVNDEHFAPPSDHATITHRYHSKECMIYFNANPDVANSSYFLMMMSTTTMTTSSKAAGGIKKVSSKKKSAIAPVTNLLVMIKMDNSKPIRKPNARKVSNNTNDPLGMSETTNCEPVDEDNDDQKLPTRQ